VNDLIRECLIRTNQITESDHRNRPGQRVDNINPPDLQVTISATDNALDVIREKVERTILDGKIFMFISRHSNAEATVPSRGGYSPLLIVPGLEPVPTVVLYVLIYLKRNKQFEERKKKKKKYSEHSRKIAI
jgi:hypothetical protein